MVHMTTQEKISFEDIMASLDKDTISKVKIGSSISREVIPTASLRLNRLLGGGFRKGKQHTIWGAEQSTKSAFVMQSAGVAQAMGYNVAWIDAEHSFDPSWATRLGLDPDRLAITEVSTIAELTDLQVVLIERGFDMIVIDSTAALMPKSFMDKNNEMKGFADTAQLGQMAKDLGQMCKMVQGINYTCAVVHISQARVDVGASSMNKPFKPVGGKEVAHTDSLRIRFMSTKADDKQIKKEIQRGANLVEEAVGSPVTWVIDKNKITGEYGSGRYDFYKKNNPEFSGLDVTGEIIDLAIDYGFIEKTGAWFTVGDKRLQGRHNVIAYLSEEPEILAKLRAEVENA
jgi:recombination protein RecA